MFELPPPKTPRDWKVYGILDALKRCDYSKAVIRVPEEARTEYREGFDLAIKLRTRALDNSPLPPK